MVETDFYPLLITSGLNIFRPLYETTLRVVEREWSEVSCVAPDKLIPQAKCGCDAAVLREVFSLGQVHSIFLYSHLSFRVVQCLI